MDGDMRRSGRSPENPRSPSGADEAAQRHRDLIGENLRAYFDSLAEPEMPERFRALLDELAKEEKRK